MVKTIIILSLLTSNILLADAYKDNCIKCHNKLPVSIDKYFYRYLLKYSSQRDIKAAMINYLKIPSKETTVMPDAFINRFGVKKESQLSEAELSDAVDSYWEEYKIFGRVR